MANNTNSEPSWDIIIKPKEKRFSLKLDEVWAYRDLIQMYVRRNIVTMYKQTILGPLWFIIQPIFTTVMFMFIFGGIAKISTEGVPQQLFYLAGILAWNYFADCLNTASATFSGNAGVFSKVYFPRLVVPISGIISNLIKLVIQLLMLCAFYIYFVYDGTIARPNEYILLFPLLIVMLAGLGFGFGIIISSLTTKYRDLAILFGFVTQLWMYGTPIAYPLSAIPTQLVWLVQLNPISHIVEAMRYGFYGVGNFSWIGLGYSFAFTIFISIIGIWMFNKIERKFIDIV